MKTISVIIPVYNVEPYLRQCIDSVLQQTYRDLEIILVDDGSPDNCPAICDEYAQKDGRVKVVHKKNGGLSSARNAGMEVATGDYICFFDSDDFVEKDMLEKMLFAIQGNNDDVCICGYSVDVLDANGTEISCKEVIPQYASIENTLSLQEYEKILGICGYAWNKLYRLQFLRQNNLCFVEGISLVEDLLFNAKVFSNGGKISFLSYAGYHYIQRQRETLGVKYYANYFELKQKAAEAKCTILQTWGVEEKRIAQFYNENFIDIIWGTIKNIQSSTLQKKDKLDKARRFIKEKDIKKTLKDKIPQDKKRKTKRFLLRTMPVDMLLKIIK